jgi:glutathione synthase/RimK-type ligase-like ATP-grasp enzyme
MSTVLILSRPNDQHLAPVIEEIRVRGVHVCYLDQADFPHNISINVQTGQDHKLWSGTLISPLETIALDSLISIWRRRPTTYKAPMIYTPGERTFIEEEADRAFLGVLDSLFSHVLWVSRTHSIRRAELKALQLSLAQHCGLRIPRTLITNEPAAARAFYETCQGNVVVKAVSRGTIEDEPQHIGRFIYTSRVEQDHLHQLEGIRVTAHLLQEYIAERTNIRVVVIGQQVFAAEIHSPHLDFRQNYDENTYRIHRLPEETKQRVLALVRACDLQFSSLDLLLTKEGNYVFLDLNPNGQWFFLQQHLPQLPLKEAMADLLTNPKDYAL